MSALSNVVASVAGEAVEFAANTEEAHGYGKADLAIVLGKNLVSESKVGMDNTQKFDI